MCIGLTPNADEYVVPSELIRILCRVSDIDYGAYSK